MDVNWGPQDAAISAAIPIVFVIWSESLLNNLLKQLSFSFSSILLMCASASSFASPINDAVRFWAFDGDYTESQKGATTTQIGGVTFGEDRDGNSGAALSLDGYNDAVRLDPSSDLDALGSYSISMWFLLETSNDRSYLLDTRAPSSSNSDGALIFMDPAGGASTHLNGYSVPGVAVNTTANLFDTNWHHVSLVRDIATSQLHLYLDGLAVDSRFTSSALVDMSDGMVIGSYGQALPGSLYWLDGNIDDVAIWDRALSAAEVTSLYTQAASATDVPGPASSLLLVIGLFGIWLSRNKLS